MWQHGLFYVFAAMSCLFGAMIIMSKHAVHSVLCLMVVFFTTACTWMLLEVEFLAITLVLVYVGAVMVLFLFLVMMLDVDFAALRSGFIRYLPVGVAIPVLLSILLLYSVHSYDFGSSELVGQLLYPAEYNNTKVLGEALFTKYIFHVELAGIILLVAMIAAIGLAFRKRRRLHQAPHTQVQVRAADRLKLVQVTPESPHVSK